MRRIILILILALAIVVVIFGGYFLWERAARVSTAELERIVQRDGVPFDVESIPDEVLDRLASNRVVVVGELHFLREHRELIAELLRDLHARGFRQYLFEWTQAADWLLADYVNDGGLMPDWIPPHDIGGDAITAIRDFNRTLPENERIQVHAIDVTLQDYGGIEGFLSSLELLAGHLPDPDPLQGFLQGDHTTSESHIAQLETLQTELIIGRSELIESWGEYWYNTVLEMVEVELAGVSVRDVRESDYDESVRLREEAIKQIVDRRLQEVPHGTLINVGSTHAQKEQLRGTEIEWLGDYLVKKSQVANGPVIVLDVSAAHIVSAPGSGIPDYDLKASPENELLRIMNQIWPDQIVLLPMDDPLFSDGRVSINFSGDIYVSAPKRHYDGFILLPLAHRDFVGD